MRVCFSACCLFISICEFNYIIYSESAFLLSSNGGTTRDTKPVKEIL